MHEFYLLWVSIQVLPHFDHKITSDKSVNCLINACRAMEPRPIVDMAWVRPNVRRLMLTIDQSTRHTTNQGLNHLSAGSTLNHYLDPQANLAWYTKQKRLWGVWEHPSPSLKKGARFWEAADAQTHATEIRWVVTVGLWGDEKTGKGGPLHQYCLTSCFASQSLIPASQK